MATTNPTYKPSESKREEFRRYLEKTGVMDGLTKALVNLYEEPEKPADAIQYIQDKLAIQLGNETLSTMKAQIAELSEKVAQLELEKAQLEAVPPAPEEGTGEEQRQSEGVIPLPVDNPVPEDAAPASAEPTAEQPPAPAE